MQQVLQIISLIIGIPSSAFMLLTLLCKPFRRWLFERNRVRETDKCLLRDRITEIYYQYKNEEVLPQYAYENLAKLYEQYKALGGNSFIDKIWSEIQGWEVRR